MSNQNDDYTVEYGRTDTGVSADFTVHGLKKMTRLAEGLARVLSGSPYSAPKEYFRQARLAPLHWHDGARGPWMLITRILP